MGNRVSLKIVLGNDDSDMVQTKQYMSGHVEAEVKFPLDTSNLGDTSVSIEFVVFEYAYVFRRMQEGRATRNLFREVKKLRSGAKKTAKILKVGVYTFPFKFYVNKTLPSSFRHRTGNEEVKVEYKLIARAGNGALVRCERQLTGIAQAIRTGSGPISMGPTEIEGKIKLALSISRAKIAKGEVLVCHVAARKMIDPKKNSARPGTLYLKLVENRKWATDDKPFFEPKRREREVTWFEKDVTMGLPGVRLSEPTLGGGNGNNPSQEEERIRDEEMTNDLTLDANKVEFTIPVEKIWNSYKGKLINVSHLVRLEYHDRQSSEKPQRFTFGRLKTKLLHPPITFDVPIEIGDSETTIQSLLGGNTVIQGGTQSDEAGTSEVDSSAVDSKAAKSEGSEE